MLDPIVNLLEKELIAVLTERLTSLSPRDGYL